MDFTQCITVNRDDRRLIGKAAGAMGLALLSTLASASRTTAPDTKVRAQANYGKLPLSFEANQGQTDAQVKFLARGQGYTLFLTPTETVLSLKKPQAKDKISQSSAKSSSTSETIGTVLRMQFAGANPTPKVVGREPLPGHVNYLIGKDPSRWHTHVPTYGKIAYEGVYPGVDLVYYGNHNQLEYDFVVAPGADPSNIKLSFKGADKIEVNSMGELVLHAMNGDIHMHKPVIYQQIGGIRKPVNGSYVLKDGQMVGFQVAAYDAAYPLIIDPVLVYSTYLGGSDDEESVDIAVDNRGRAYVAGQTTSIDFPNVNALQPTYGGGPATPTETLEGPSDGFVAQLTADGSALRYATYLGGTRFDRCHAIAVNNRGQATVTGITQSLDFPTRNALQPAYGGGRFDAFVSQLSADGSELRYSTYLGGSDFDAGEGIAVDRSNRVYVTGGTGSANFPTRNALQATHHGIGDGFVTQLTANGRAIRYSTFLGGREDDRINAIAVDLLGQAYVTGETRSPDFPTRNALQPTFHNFLEDAFVAKLSADGRTLRYSTFLGTNGGDTGSDIAVDLLGRAYVAGSTDSRDFPTVNAIQPTSGGSGDAFVARFTADGSALNYSTYLGGSSGDSITGIAVDLSGQAYVTGGTQSPDFPIKNAPQPTLASEPDAFVAKLSADGRALRYSTYLGGSSVDTGRGIAVDLRGQAYVIGVTNSPDFPTRNALQPDFGGGQLDAFVTKMGSDDRF
jgi:hypothetical protein